MGSPPKGSSGRASGRDAAWGPGRRPEPRLCQGELSGGRASRSSVASSGIERGRRSVLLPAPPRCLPSPISSWSERGRAVAKGAQAADSTRCGGW
eukprot:7992039-Pyramimonas_sp.AAC.1